MAKLTKSARAAIPTSKFAGPNRSFPIPDKAHAKAAIMLSGHAANPAAVKAAARSVLSGHPHQNLGAYLHPKKTR
jgi:hypothetical protein